MDDLHRGQQRLQLTIGLREDEQDFSRRPKLVLEARCDLLESKNGQDYVTSERLKSFTDMTYNDNPEQIKICVAQVFHQLASEIEKMDDPLALRTLSVSMMGTVWATAERSVDFAGRSPGNVFDWLHRKSRINVVQGW